MEEVAANADVVLCAKEVAKLLRVSPWYVYELAKSGDIPSIRLRNRSVRFRRQAIQDWMVQQEKSQKRR